MCACASVGSLAEVMLSINTVVIGIETDYSRGRNLEDASLGGFFPRF